MTETTSRPGPRAPWSLRGAGALAVVQGVATTVLGVIEIFSVSGDRWVMGATTALFFVVYGVVLAVCGAGLWRTRPWARGPVLFAQLVWLLMAWSFRGGETTAVAVPIAVLALVVLAGLLHPASLRALDRSRAASEG